MSEKIRLDEKQMATLESALTTAALATHHYADVADAAGDQTLSVVLRNQAEDFEVMLGIAPFVERITVRVTDEAPGFGNSIRWSTYPFGTV